MNELPSSDPVRKGVRGWVLLHAGKPSIFETVSRKQFIQNWGPLQQGETVVRAEVRVIKRRRNGR